MISCTVLIPALNPGQALLELAGSLEKSEGVRQILVVDDGNAAANQSVFDSLQRLSKVHLLRHGVNRGKGAALRTGMETYLRSPAAENDVLVTADADGQHRMEDILKVAEAAACRREALVLGTRGFDVEVPWRSRFGNDLTRLVFRLVSGLGVEDTQTGLRALPRTFLPDLLRLRTNRYEFEMDMLLLAARSERSILEVSIRTIYIDGNTSSHFNPLLDSVRIYLVLIRHAFAGLFH